MIGAGGEHMPSLLMRTSILALKAYPRQLTPAVCDIVMRRLVERRCWEHPKVWEGFIMAAKMTAQPNPPNCFATLLQLPPDRIQQVCARARARA